MDGRRGAALLVLVCATLVIVGDPTFGAKVPRATCLDCHEKEGMKYATIIVSPLLELAQNETFPVEVTVANPWLHSFTDVTVELSLPTPTLEFQIQDPLSATETTLMGPGTGTEEFEVPFEVGPGATGAVVRMMQDDAPQAADIDLFVIAPNLPDGIPAAPPDGLNPPQRLDRGPNARETVALEAAAVSAGGTGTWRALARHQPSAGIFPSGGPTEVELRVDVFYNASSTQTLRKIEEVDKGANTVFTFQVAGRSAGAARLEVAVTVTAHFKHPTGIGAQDDGNETLRSRLDFNVGSSTRLGEQSLLPTTPPLNWNLVFVAWGEATGWAGLFLVPMSLVLGGAFGRRNVLLVNRFARNGRTRVLWHNAVSFILLAMTGIHIVLFIIEPRYQWSVGLVWGGIGTLALLGLAVTGLWWRGISKRWGYHTWRTLHIAMAIVFTATVVVHVLAEGAHFDWARSALGMT